MKNLSVMRVAKKVAQNGPFLLLGLGHFVGQKWPTPCNTLKIKGKGDCTTKTLTQIENSVQKQPLAVVCSVLRYVCKDFEEHSDETADPSQQAIAKPGLEPDAKRWVDASQEPGNREGIPTGVEGGANAIDCCRPEYYDTRRVAVSDGFAFRAHVRNAQRSRKRAARSATMLFSTKGARLTMLALCISTQRNLLRLSC